MTLRNIAKLPPQHERQIHDTIAAKRRYLKAFARLGFPKKSAAAADVGHRTVVKWRAFDPEFAQQEVYAKEKYLEKLEEEADRRGVDGFLDPIMHDGEVVAHRRKYSDHLLMFRLKKLDPEYRERGSSSSEGPTQINIYLPDNQRADDKVVIDVTPSQVKLEDKS